MASLELTDGLPAAPEAAEIEIFDPPMCCPTGLCGPSLDQTLLDVNEMILALESAGKHVARYQMASQPQAFLNNAAVIRLVHEQQMAALPITVVRGQVVQVGAYPSLSQIQTALSEHSEPTAA